MLEQEKIKILIATGLYPPDVGGPATYAKIIAEGLEEKGIKTKVVNFGQVRELPKGLSHLVYTIKLAKNARGADKIFALDPVSVGLPACLASWLSRRPFWVRVAGDYAWEQSVQRGAVEKSLDEFVEGGTDSKLASFFKKVQIGVAKRAESIITPSEYLKSIVKKWGIHGSKINVIYSVVTPPPELPSEEDIRNELHLSGDIISTAGRLVPWKGFLTLIEAVSEIVKEKLNVKLLIFGTGPQEEKIRQKIRELGLEEHIHILQNLSKREFFKYLKASDVFALNSGYEGLSHQLLEVLHLGTPIVTTKVGGNPELIGNKENGILVEYNDRQALKEEILNLLDDRSFANELAKNGKHTASVFNKDDMLEQLASILKKNL